MIHRKKISAPEVSLEGTFVAGGAILSPIIGQEVSDYDVYPKDQSKLFDILVEADETYGAYVVNISDKCITLKCNKVIKSDGQRCIMQIVTIENFENADKIFETFDFTVCMGAYDCDENKFYYHESFWEDVASRRINYNVDTRYPYASLVRLRKYIKKGFSISKSEYIKLGMSIARYGLPDSWDELEKIMGGFYGKSLKLEVEYKEFNFDNAVEVLSNLKIRIEDESEDKTIKTYNRIIKTSDESVFDLYVSELAGNVPTLVKYGGKNFVYDNSKNTITNIIYNEDAVSDFFGQWGYRPHEFSKFVFNVREIEKKSGRSHKQYSAYRYHQPKDCSTHVVKHYMVAITCDIDDVPHILSKGDSHKLPFAFKPLTMETEYDNMTAFAMNVNVAKTITEQATKDGTIKDGFNVNFSRFLFLSNNVTDYLNDDLMIVKKGVVTIDSKKTI